MPANGETTEQETWGRLFCRGTLICALALAGCSRQQQSTSSEPALVPDVGTAEAMEIAEEVLAKMHFAIEKADVSAGYIRTRPLAGAQFFEFWRSDNVGPENSLQANLHSIRRTVELNINRQDGQLRIACDVRVQRLSLPERELGSSTRAYGMYTRSSPTLQKLKFDPDQVRDIAWIDLDEDMELGGEILQRIQQRIAGRASDESQSAENRT